MPHERREEENNVNLIFTTQQIAIAAKANITSRPFFYVHGVKSSDNHVTAYLKSPNTTLNYTYRYLIWCKRKIS